MQSKRERELSHELQKLKMENEALRQQKTGLQLSIDQLQSAQNNLQMQLDQIVLHDAKITTELTEANAALAKKMASEQHWQNQHDNIHLKWQEQLQMVIELKTKNAVLSEQTSAMKAELDEIAEQNKVLAHDKWILGQEKAQLFGQLKQWESTVTTG